MGVTKPKDEYEEKAKTEKKKEPPKPKKIEEQVETKAIVRLTNTDLDGEKPLMMALQGIKGIGYVMSNAICSVSGLDPKAKLGNLSESDREKLEKIIKDPISSGIPSYLVNRRKDPETGKDFHLTSSDFDVARKFDIQRLIDLKTFKGWRHMLGQPVRGQRTRAHFRGGRIVGVMRKAIKAQMQAAQKEGEKKEK